VQIFNACQVWRILLAAEHFQAVAGGTVRITLFNDTKLTVVTGVQQRDWMPPIDRFRQKMSEISNFSDLATTVSELLINWNRTDVAPNDVLPAQADVIRDHRATPVDVQNVCCRRAMTLRRCEVSSARVLTGQ